MKINDNNYWFSYWKILPNIRAIFLQDKVNISECFLSVYQTKIHYIRIHYRQMILMIKISTVINANKPIPANTYSILPPCLNGRMLWWLIGKIPVVFNAETDQYSSDLFFNKDWMAKYIGGVTPCSNCQDCHSYRQCCVYHGRSLDVFYILEKIKKKSYHTAIGNCQTLWHIWKLNLWW